MNKKSVFISLIIIYCLLIGILFSVTFVGKRAVTAVSSRILPKDRICIVVDAGHGGVDGGATSCTGVLESKINLEIALRVNDMLHLMGINTKMIRTMDISVYTKGESIAAKKVSDLKNRVNTVNDTENAMLISIHQNHFTDSKYRGAQVFYSANDSSDQWAKHIQTAMIENLNPNSKRGIKKADGIYLLQNVDCPAVLVECGFLSNPEEEALLRNSDYQKKLSAVMAATTSVFIRNYSIS